MAGQPLKRLRSIKIRVSDAELERLREICPKAQLAEWMREQCLGVVQPQRRTPAPTVDPALLRQLAGMGNNLNQIARFLHATGGPFSPGGLVALRVNRPGSDGGSQSWEG